MTSFSTTARAEKKFGVAVAALDRRGKHVDVSAAERGGKRPDVRADLLVHVSVSDYAALVVMAQNLELRLDQREQVHRRSRERQGDREYGLQRDEADIDDDDVRPRRQPLVLETADVGRFHRDDLRM